MSLSLSLSLLQFVLKKFLLDKGFDEPLDVMRRQGSILSLSALSQTSTTSMKASSRDLPMQTFALLCKGTRGGGAGNLC